MPSYLAGLIGIAGLIAAYNLVTIRRATGRSRVAVKRAAVVRDLESLETLIVAGESGRKGR